MKNVLFISMIALLLTACRKEYCWQCETTISTVVTNPGKDSTTLITSKSDMLCGRTSKEIRSDEKKNTTDSTWKDGDATIRRSLKMSCRK